MSAPSSLLIVSIDPGVSALGFAVARVQNPFHPSRLSPYFAFPKEVDMYDMMRSPEKVEWLNVETIDMRSLVPRCRDRTTVCTLEHSNHMVDRIDHLLAQYPVLHEADLLLLEAQPPAGCLEVQNLLLARLPRHKIKMIQPSVRNKFAGYSAHYDADMDGPERRMVRKHETVKMVRQWLDARWLQGPVELIHDRVDACYMIFMHCKVELLPRWLAERMPLKIPTVAEDKTLQPCSSSSTVISISMFDKYRYKPSKM